MRPRQVEMLEGRIWEAVGTEELSVVEREHLVLM